MRVALGSVRLAEAQYYDTERVIAHEEYVFKEFDNDTVIIENDIALVKLKDKIQFNQRVQPIPLAEDYTDGGKEAVVSGWGKTENEVYAHVK